MGGDNQIVVTLCTDCTSAMRKYALTHRPQLPVQVRATFCDACEAELARAKATGETNVTIKLGPAEKTPSDQ
jgi:RNase P subunit RPR2